MAPKVGSNVPSGGRRHRRPQQRMSRTGACRRLTRGTMAAVASWFSLPSLCSNPRPPGSELEQSGICFLICFRHVRCSMFVHPRPTVFKESRKSRARISLSSPSRFSMSCSVSSPARSRVMRKNSTTSPCLCLPPPRQAAAKTTRGQGRAGPASPLRCIEMQRRQGPKSENSPVTSPRRVDCRRVARYRANSVERHRDVMRCRARGRNGEGDCNHADCRNSRSRALDQRCKPRRANSQSR